MIEFKDFKVGELFEIRPTKSYGLTNDVLLKVKGNTPVVSNISVNNGVLDYIALVPTESGGIITFSDTGTNATKSIFYQSKDFVGYSHVQGMFPKFDPCVFTENVALYISTVLRATVDGKYDYSRKFNRENVSNTVIKLPVNKDGFIDWGTMDKEIEGYKNKNFLEIKKYFDQFNYENSNKNIIDEINKSAKKEFYLKDLFDCIKRGKRLKSFDRIPGSVPFITAGEENMGFSAYIGNKNVEVFPANSLTIDMFGNTFYRGYAYGADDHVAVLYNTQNTLSKHVLQYIQPHIEKSISGKFSYSRNFYASDAPDIAIDLPINDNGELNTVLIEDYMKFIERKTAKLVVEKYINNI